MKNTVAAILWKRNHSAFRQQELRLFERSILFNWVMKSYFQSKTTHGYQQTHKPSALCGSAEDRFGKQTKVAQFH